MLVLAGISQPAFSPFICSGRALCHPFPLRGRDPRRCRGSRGDPFAPTTWRRSFSQGGGASSTADRHRPMARRAVAREQGRRPLRGRSPRADGGDLNHCYDILVPLHNDGHILPDLRRIIANSAAFDASGRMRTPPIGCSPAGPAEAGISTMTRAAATMTRALSGSMLNASTRANMSRSARIDDDEMHTFQIRFGRRAMTRTGI